jgi:hypothetical protein
VFAAGGDMESGCQAEYGIHALGKRRTTISFAIAALKIYVSCDGRRLLVGQSLSLNKNVSWSFVFGRRLGEKWKRGRCRQATAFRPEDRDRLL